AKLRPMRRLRLRVGRRKSERMVLRMWSLFHTRDHPGSGADWSDNKVGKKARCDHEQSQDRRKEAQRAWRGRGSYFSSARGDVDLFQHLKIVVERDGAHGEAEDEQPKQTAIVSS